MFNVSYVDFLFINKDHELLLNKVNVFVCSNTHEIRQKIDSTDIKYDVDAEQTKIAPVMLIENIECWFHPLVSRSTRAKMTSSGRVRIGKISTTT